MEQLCASHPDSSSTGRCAACGRPFCAACVVEDVAAELSFCSTACLGSQKRNPQLPSRPNADLVDGLRRPIRTGWQLWLRQLGPVTVWVGIPIGVAFGLLRFAAVGTAWGQAGSVSTLYDLGLWVCFALAAAAVAVLLSRAYTGLPGGSPWAQVASRFLPWLISWILFGAGVILGSLLLIIPGIIAGVRLFWADEFALIHRHGPLSALRESVELTRGQTARVFTFQIALGFAEYLVLIPVILGFIGAGAVAESLPSGLLTTVALSTFLSVLSVNAYASVHAPEIVYFYGLRALRAEMPAEEIRGDWVSRGLRGVYGSESQELQSCPSCGSAWNPADYREDAKAIFCSCCKAQITRPG
jgi:hypothetical protein